MPSTPGRRSVPEAMTDGALVRIDDLSVTFGTGARAVDMESHGVARAVPGSFTSRWSW